MSEACESDKNQAYKQERAFLLRRRAAVEMQYDALNRRTRVKDSLGTTTIKRDWTGSIIAVAKDGAPLRDYTYDPFSNRARMTDHRKGKRTYLWSGYYDRRITEYYM